MPPGGFLGQSPKPPEATLTLEGGASNPKVAQNLTPTSQARQRKYFAPPNSTNSANPLTWETSRFPSHGELRTGFPKRGGPKLLQQLPLTVEKLLTVRPLPLPLAPVF